MPRDLMQACAAARDGGADFPIIWKTILSRHPLVTGVPVQGMRDGRPQLEVPLRNGQRLIYDSNSCAYDLLPSVAPWAG